MKSSRFLVLIVTCFVLLATGVVPAQEYGFAGGVKRAAPGVPAAQMPEVLREVAYEQHLDAQLPLDAPFRDESGRLVRLGDYFTSRPVVLALVYYDCPMLCTQVLNSLVASLRVLSFETGREFDVVAVSFDPRERPELASAKKRSYLERYGRRGVEDGWHFLTGDEGAITRLTSAVGFRYVYDKDTLQFAHPAGITVVTPAGRLARYFFGIEYPPRDLRFALVEASDGRIGSRVDQVLLYCYHYNPATGKYGLVTMRIVRLGGIATVLALAVLIVLMERRPRTRNAEPA